MENVPLAANAHPLARPLDEFARSVVELDEHGIAKVRETLETFQSQCHHVSFPGTTGPLMISREWTRSKRCDAREIPPSDH